MRARIGKPLRRIHCIIEALLGHADLSLTARYAQVATNLIAATSSPFDRLST